MDFKDLLIIYLAAGAPFAVYYFFRHRRNSRRLAFWFNLLLRFFVWFLYALPAAQRFVARKLENGIPRPRASLVEVPNARDAILQEFVSCQSNRKFFEAREIVERYIALTDAKKNFAQDTVRRETELFRIALRQNTQLAARCLHRRNLAQVEQHQLQARNDLSELCSKSAENDSSLMRICEKIIALAQLLDDQILEQQIVNLSKTTQTEIVRAELKSYHFKPAR